MKNFSMLFLLAMTYGFAQAAEIELRCDVVTVHDGELEESLYETGTSYADQDSQSVRLESVDNQAAIQVGTQSWDAFLDQDVVTTVEDNEHETKFTATDRDVQTVMVRVYKKSGLGVVLHKYIDNDEKDDSSQKSSYNLIASIDCNDYSAEKKIIENSEETQLVDLATLNPTLIHGLSRSDTAVDLGDGYYSVMSSELFAVMQNGKVMGYKRISFVSYTEDPEDMIVAEYFLPNGVRFLGPEVLEVIPREDKEDF